MDNEDYIRVATSYLKRCSVPMNSGEFRELYLPWNIETIRQDHSKDFVAKIRKYDGYCFFPAHVDYKRVHGNFLNMYEPLADTPSPGEFPNIRLFLSHIFGEQIELGLDYIQLLYLQPRRWLPILLLVSLERNTGKTTFIHLLKAIFGGNMTINTNEDFRSNFNSEWANKLIIATDEVLLNRREDSDRFKTLSTARTFKLEAKGKDRLEIEFFGKFILCSNNEDNPVIIDHGETRYWVRKIKPIEKDDTELLSQMKAEIPAFLHFLLHRELSVPEVSRMWFDPELLTTSALRRIIQYNRGQLENEMLGILEDIFHVYGQDEYKFCIQDMQNMLGLRDIRTEPVKIKRILQDSWKLKPDKVARYTSYRLSGDGTLFPEPRTGRPYSVARSFVEEKLLFCNSEE
jgi:hypothetical protein